MNIFVVSIDPIKAAKMLCDKHIVKMPVETAQMLTYINNKPSGIAHVNHPCTLWAGSNHYNYNWLVSHGIALCDEYERRYGRVHASKTVIEHWRVPKTTLSPQFSSFVQCMPEQYKHDDVTLAYRRYYHSKFQIAQWKHSEKPEWYIGMLGILYPERIKGETELIMKPYEGATCLNLC